MNHGSLFSGIGGFDLAAQWAGWNNVFHCEINPFGQRVLKYYWPNSISYDDITKTDFTIHRGTIDILTGGFPCQPFSIAGKRLGTADNRNLWPEYFRAIKEIQPTWVVGENVPGLLNWSNGLVFEQVQADLENEGYEVWPLILPACGVNAPHRRDRVWFIAHSISARARHKSGEELRQTHGGDGTGEVNSTSANETTPYSSSPGRKELHTSEKPKEQGYSSGCNNKVTCNAEPMGRERSERITRSIRFNPGTWDKWPTVKPTICTRNDGFPEQLVGLTFSKWRNESIKAAGNAIVPQVAYQIFKAINTFNSQTHENYN